MDYRELEPSAALRPFVRCFWSLRAPAREAGVGAERIVPDGCSEIVLNRADPFRRLRGAVQREQESVLLVGPAGRAITIAPTGEVDLIGVRLEPGGLHALLGVPVHELADEDLCLGQVDRRLRDELDGAARADSRRDNEGIDELERVLARRIDGSRARTTGFQRVRAAVGLVATGLHTADRLAARVDTSRRTLERLFRTHVGLSPKLYARVVRLQSALGRLDGGRPARGWADLAAACGYVDQSHLIRDFRLLAGTTPERHLAERAALSTCFETGLSPPPAMR